MEQLQKLNSKIATLKNDKHGEPPKESTPINLEILLSESIVESNSGVIIENPLTYGGGFNLTGNNMSLNLDGTEYSTEPKITHFILTGGITADGKGIFRRHFANYHTVEQGKMIKDSVIGDLVLNFKAKADTPKSDENVYLVLPIFKTENSNLNGSEILKLAAGISNGNAKQKGKDKDKLESSLNKTKNDPMGFNQLQLTSNANMSTNGFRDFETVNLTKMIKNEVPIIKYKIGDSIILIFLSSSINVSHHALTNGNLLGRNNVVPSVPGGTQITELKYYTNGIEVDTRKSMNCQPISDKGQVIKEINKGPVGEQQEIDIIEQIESLTKTFPGQVIFGVIATIFLYLVVFSSMNIVYKLYNGINTAAKVLSKEFGGRGVGITGNLKAAGIRGNLRPQNKGVVKK
jgi:hypothetical protein